ncbi:MAG: alpha/beta hydrolase [Cytophagales bacterium]|nr:alpha/beta hydrolase [Cytophagales bacterium]
MKSKKHNIFRLVWFSLVIVFLVWQWSSYQSKGLPHDTFANSDKVIVEQNDDKITFVARNTSNKTEIIFFQGGLADPKAYAPLCRQFAERGFTCHLIKMGWRIPRWNYNKIETLFNIEKNKYIIGGHSQGAKMASQFVHENPNLLKGLYLLGTSHPRDYDLSDRIIPTIKLYAELDGLASVPEVMENKAKLPKNTIMKAIEGGNHSQFGYLGKLLTDESPRIGLEEQQEATLEYLMEFFQKVENE